MFDMYVNNPGDDGIIDDEEDAHGLQAMADFLHDITD